MGNFIEERPYLLDGKPVSFTELIHAAEEIGYASTDGLLHTSEAAQVLRHGGHSVEENP